jgi:hypothetical protein
MIYGIFNASMLSNKICSLIDASKHNNFCWMKWTHAQSGCHTSIDPLEGPTFLLNLTRLLKCNLITILPRYNLCPWKVKTSEPLLILCCLHQTNFTHDTTVHLTGYRHYDIHRPASWHPSAEMGPRHPEIMGHVSTLRLSKNKLDPPDELALLI